MNQRDFDPSGVGKDFYDGKLGKAAMGNKYLSDGRSARDELSPIEGSQAERHAGARAN